MARLMPINRYRMVDLRTGAVVVVFMLYPGMQPLESCRRACHELGIDVEVGNYRLDTLKQDIDTKKFKWKKIYKFSLEQHS